MRYLIMFAIAATTQATVLGSAMEEVNEWRRRCGLPQFVEDPMMTEFAAMKAQYRAERNLRNGHQGPAPVHGWHEGTGEAFPMWGWLTCEMESDFKYAGAAMCVGRDGTRFMVLVCRDGSGRALVRRNGAPVHDTSYLTPNPPRVGSKSSQLAKSPAAAETLSETLSEPTETNVKVVSKSDAIITSVREMPASNARSTTSRGHFSRKRARFPRRRFRR